MTLYVGNLSSETSEVDLCELFSRNGTVRSCRIITDRDTGRSHGFAFVEMNSEAESLAAIELLAVRELDGRQLTVDEARPRGRRAFADFG